MEYLDQSCYIPPSGALKKLKTAWSAPCTAYLYGATGYGKTALVQYFLKNRRYVCLSCGEDWDSADIPDAAAEGRSIVVVDGLHLLRREEQKQTVLGLFQRRDVWLVLVSRSPIPSWLLPAYIRHGFLVIDEGSFWLSEAEIAAYLEAHGVSCSPELSGYLRRAAQGNAYTIRHTVLRMREGAVPGPELESEVRGAFAQYLENSVLPQWDSDLLEFLMEASVVDAFDLELAEMISGNSRAAALLERAAETGNFLSREAGTYRMRPVLVQALRNRALKVWGTGRLKDLARKAGTYYELHEDVVRALRLYEYAGSGERIRQLLIRNARRNPGNGHYYELRQYYFRLEESEIEGSPVLLAGMSMLCSMLMDAERSEYWYARLKAFARTAQGGERREALSRLTYLDIGLPHRGSGDLIAIIKRVPQLLFRRGIGLPEFSVTSNLPSTMNGGKDFCAWSKIDQELADTIGPLVERVLGRYGKGLVKAALGESLYEKGGDNCHVLSLLTQAQVESEGGAMEIGFAAVGLQVRLYLTQGRAQAAQAALDSFERAVREQGAVQLLPNLQALRCRLALLLGDTASAEEWMRQAPDEKKEFCCLERYRYLTKVRCYLLEGAELEALALLEKLRWYAGKCQRTYVLLEAGVLSAIARERLGQSWEQELRDALRIAEEFRFLRAVTEEGAAVWPLLRRLKLEPSGWSRRLVREAGEMAQRYPLYLRRQSTGTGDFCEAALQILRLQSQGLTVNQIAGQMGLKPDTVKYHIKENYRKLGVSGKAGAALAAKNLGIL